MVPLQVVVLFLATFARPSRAVYCICKDGASKEAMENDINYACGFGADCSSILPSGPCYQPNTVKDHCNYAVNSYFQRQGQVTGGCNFSGSATTSAFIPNQVAGCVYQASPSSATFTPPPATGTGMTPTMGTPPATIFTPPTGTGMTPTMGTPPPTIFTPPTGTGITPTTGTPPATIFTPPTGTGMTPMTGTPPATIFTPPTGTGMTPTTGTPPATIATPGLGPTSGTGFNNGATSMTIGKGTLLVVLLIVAWI